MRWKEPIRNLWFVLVPISFFLMAEPMWELGSWIWGVFALFCLVMGLVFQYWIEKDEEVKPLTVVASQILAKGRRKSIFQILIAVKDKYLN